MISMARIFGAPVTEPHGKRAARIVCNGKAGICAEIVDTI
jgi:hypothetical protein